ncbi:MAG: FAD-dependent oxidoreductase, partial [Gemmataceae bacterium]
DLRFPMKPDLLPNGKTDTNNNCAFSTDAIGLNYDYPEAGYEEREAILAAHVSYQQGLMWTLANHPRVPQKIRDEMAKWG